MAATPFSLAPAWGKAPCVLPPGWLDLSSVRTDLASIDTLLRGLDESALKVRVPGDRPESGVPPRISLADLGDLTAYLQSGKRLHLQAIDLEQHDAGYAELARRFRRRIEVDIPEVRDASTRVMVGLFLSTGGAIAPFHADYEHNFLSQVVGDKKMHMFPSDLDIFPCTARERLAVEDYHMLDTYSPALESRAEVVELVPGTTLYHPPMSPHWVDTGRTSYSLSYTVSFTTPSVERTLLLHKLNQRLRRIGVKPAPVGSRPGVESAKLVVARALRGAARLRRSLRG